MLFYHTKHVIAQQKKKAVKKGNNEEEEDLGLDEEETDIDDMYGSEDENHM